MPVCSDSTLKPAQYNRQAVKCKHFVDDMLQSAQKCSAVPCSSLQEAETLVSCVNRQEWFKCVILHTSPLLPLGPTSPWFRRNEKEETFMIKSEINLLLNTQTGSIFTAGDKNWTHNNVYEFIQASTEGFA